MGMKKAVYFQKCSHDHYWVQFVKSSFNGADLWFEIRGEIRAVFFFVRMTFWQVL